LRRGRGERGIALVSVLIVALLYFAFLALLLAESTEAFRSAERFRARTVARVMADNGAELAASNMIAIAGQEVSGETDEGSMSGTYRRSLTEAGDRFEIVARGESTGPGDAEAWIRINGYIAGNDVVISHISVRN
jgi:type II secretory pathway component PulK